MSYVDGNLVQGVDHVDIPCGTAGPEIPQAMPVASVVDSRSVPCASGVDYERFAARYPSFRSVPDIRAIVIESIVCGHYDGLIELS